MWGALSLFLRIFPGLDNSENDDDDDDQNSDQRAAHQLPRLLLQLLGFYQLRHPLLHMVASLRHLLMHVTRTLSQNSHATYGSVIISFGTFRIATEEETQKCYPFITPLNTPTKAGPILAQALRPNSLTHLLN